MSGWRVREYLSQKPNHHRLGYSNITEDCQEKAGNYLLKKGSTVVRLPDINKNPEPIEDLRNKYSRLLVPDTETKRSLKYFDTSPCKGKLPPSLKTKKPRELIRLQDEIIYEGIEPDDEHLLEPIDSHQMTAQVPSQHKLEYAKFLMGMKSTHDEKWPKPPIAEKNSSPSKSVSKLRTVVEREPEIRGKEKSQLRVKSLKGNFKVIFPPEDSPVWMRPEEMKRPKLISASIGSLLGKLNMEENQARASYKLVYDPVSKTTRYVKITPATQDDPEREEAVSFRNYLKTQDIKKCEYPFLAPEEEYCELLPNRIRSKQAY